MKFTKNDALYATCQVFPRSKNVTKINKGFSHDIFEVETGEYPEKVIIKISYNQEPKHSLEKEKRIHFLLF